MIATITLNPSLDEHIMVNGLVLEETNRWVKRRRYAGGKGVDVSRAINEMGGTTVAYGFIGGLNGQALQILLDKEGVLFSFTPIRQETRTNFIITDTKTCQQTRLAALGPHISKGELDRFIKKMRSIRPRPDLLVASGSVPPGVPATVYHEIVTEAKAYGVRTIVDTVGQWLEEAIKAEPYLIKPNLREAETLLGRELPTEEAVIEAALELRETGIKIVVISRGKDGIIAATSEDVVKAVAPPVKVRSAVGAGDCAIAGLAIKLANGEPLLEACRLAVAMGAACVLTTGTELCRRADVERLLPQINVGEVPVKQRSRAFFAATT